jgi:NAD-dependent SIR2 family protein deacetylase
MTDMVKASDCKCIKCGQQAVAFWPVIDPDIPSHPYCRKCLDKEKLKAMIGAFGEEQGTEFFNAWNAIKKKED